MREPAPGGFGDVIDGGLPRIHGLTGREIATSAVCLRGMESAAELGHGPSRECAASSVVV